MEKFDILIPAAPKDRNKLKFLLVSIEKHITGFSGIYITVPDKSKFEGYIPECKFPVHVYNDVELLDIDISKFPYRPNWIYQQYLKFFQDVTEHDLFLTIDSDVIINRDMPMFESDGRRIFWMGWEQNHRPYFKFQELAFNLPRIYPHTFINDMNFMSKTIIKEILSKSNYTRDSFIEFSKTIMNKDCFPGEPEIYGQFVHKYYPHLYSFRQTNSISRGKFTPTFETFAWTDEEILATINEFKGTDMHLFTLHTWFNMKGTLDT